jgi:hypothetical protein
MNAVRLCLALTAFLLTTNPTLATRSWVPGHATMALCMSSLTHVATPSAETSRG